MGVGDENLDEGARKNIRDICRIRQLADCSFKYDEIKTPTHSTLSKEFRIVAHDACPAPFVDFGNDDVHDLADAKAAWYLLLSGVRVLERKKRSEVRNASIQLISMVLDALNCEGKGLPK